MMKAWQRRANKLALDWGVANRRQVEVIRKGFEGWARTSAITGESEPHYPEWRRSVKYVLTGVVMLMQASIWAAATATTTSTSSSTTSTSTLPPSVSLCRS